jgi:hypothetical protein
METKLYLLLVNNIDTIITFFGGTLLWLAKRLIGKMDSQTQLLADNLEEVDERLVKLEKQFLKLHTEHHLMHKEAGIVLVEEEV